MYWRYILVIVILVILYPTVKVMHQVEDLQKQGKKEEAARKKKLLNLGVAGLVGIFLVVLAITMYSIYSK
ncbi:MAG: hypothetical protein Q4P20_08535 [Eubacteriales bacterium]|nr:hypothetical protein [Eubacteriales bacterium]